MAYTPRWESRKNDVLAIAEQVKAAHPAAWDELKVPGQESRTYINLVSIACLEAGIQAGVNLKRGGPQQSIDVLAFPNQTGVADSTQTYAGLELVDIVGGAEGPNPSLGWGDVTQKTIDAGVKGGWVAGSVSQPQPGPQPGPVQPYPDEPKWWGAIFTPAVLATYAEAKRPFPDHADDAVTLDGFRHWSRTAYDIRDGMTKEDAMTKRIKELRGELGLPAKG